MRMAELPAYLRMLAGRADMAAAPAVNGMAVAYRDRVKNVTLRRYAHAKGERTSSPPGEPPAYVSGDLARSVFAILAPGSSGGLAWASVSPHTVYAATQEYGNVIHAHARTRGGWTGHYLGGERGPGQHTMHFWYGGSEWFPMTVHIPERSYMRRTVHDMIAEGSLSRACAEGFYGFMWA